MKIALCSAHIGNTRMVLDFLEDHEVVVYDNSVYHDRSIDFGNEDVIISAFPYRDLPLHKGDKPLIVFATNPFFDYEKDLLRLQEQDWCTVVHYGEDNTYHTGYPIKPRTSIKHAIKPERLPKWNPKHDYVVIPNRKATERWANLSEGVYGKVVYLEEFMFDVPFVIPHHLSDGDYYNLIAQSKGIFHISNNPDTLTLFEVMSMGVPIVAFDWWNGKNQVKGNVYKAYNIPASCDMEEIREMFRQIIANPTKPTYTVNDFYHEKHKWNEVLNYAVSKRTTS